MGIERTFIIIEPFMIDYDLPLTELLVYGIIHAFSKQKQGCFWGSQQYLGEQIGKSRNAVNMALKRLIDDGLVVKNTSDCGKNEYTTVQNVNPSYSTPVTTVNKGVNAVNKTVTTVNKGVNVVYKMLTPVTLIDNNINLIQSESIGESIEADTHTPTSVHPLVPLLVEILPDLVINTDPTLTEEQYRTIADEFSKSSFLRDTVHTLLKLHKMHKGILGGDYRDFKRTNKQARKAEAEDNSDNFMRRVAAGEFNE